MSQQHHPLEADWVEFPLAIDVEGRAVAGSARANWGAVEVAITSPVLGLQRSQDRRGWAFAMAACHRPEEYRFALAGKVTPKGRARAEALMADLFLDWLAVSRHEAEVDLACRRTRQELADLADAADARARPLREEHAALRRAFKDSELTQQQHQQKRREVRRRLDAVEHTWSSAEYSACERLTERLHALCGRKLSLEEAERLLSLNCLILITRPL